MDPADLLEALVLRLLDRVEAGEPSDRVLEQLSAEQPAQASALRRRAGLLADLGVLTVAPTGDSLPERLGEFRILSRLGRGGMGVVFLAQQDRLKREVAVKVVHPAQLLFSGARERFRREVEAIAKLQHPGIVPVYAVGEQDGVPYLAMERVRGVSLAELLAPLQGREARSLTGADMVATLAALVPDSDDPDGQGYVFSSTWEEACLRVVRQVAEALHHAHRRGVIHRDVKPSNVMLGADGRAQLLDFGLAAAEGSESLTRSGSPLGSLPYMSPEQTRGELSRVDARTDVYALGVVLYELLTVRPAFSRSSAAETMSAIQLGQREAPRRVNSAVSWEAETVCLTAMDPDPARRYDSAADLSRDLANVLEHRPVEARRAGTALRVRRWAQRHPAAAVGCVLGTLLLVGGPSLYAWQQHRAAVQLRAEQGRTETQRQLAVLSAEEAHAQRTRAEAAALRAETERAKAQASAEVAEDERARALSEAERAEAHLQAALTAVDAMLSRVGDHTLRYVPQMEAVRRDLLEQAVQLHRGFLEREGADPQLLLASARVLQQAGDIQNQLGDVPRAEALFSEAVAALERLLAELPEGSENHEARLELALSLRKLAKQHWESGRNAQANELNRRALWEQERALLRPGVSDFEKAQFGTTLSNHGGTVWMSDPQEAERALRRAAEIFAELALANPKNSGYAHSEAGAWSGLGSVLASSGRLDESGPVYERALATLEALAAAEPRITEYPQQLGMTLSNMAIDLADSDSERAERYALRAIGLFEQLAADYPSSTAYRYEQARALTNLGLVRFRAGQSEPALDAWQRAAAVHEGLLLDMPGAAHVRQGLGMVTGNAADVHMRAGRLDAARQLALRSLDLFQELLAISPGEPSYLLGLGRAVHTLGEVAHRAGDEALAEQLLLAAVQQTEQALATNPLDAEIAPELAAQRRLLETVRAALAGGSVP